MGLGLIALGFILLEGLKLGINSFMLIPEYVSFMIMLIGLLCVRKRKKINSLNLAGIFILVLFVLLFIPTSAIPIFPISLIFYGILFYGIYQLTGNTRTKKYYISFILVYIIVYIGTLVYSHFGNEEYNTFLLILLIMKVVFVYIIAYHWYKDNKILDDVYEINNVESQYNISTKTLLLTFIASFVTIVLIQGPLMNQIEKDKYIKKNWYGEIEDKVIVERMWIQQSTGLVQETEVCSPCIWINQSDFDQSQYFSLSFLDNKIDYNEIVREDFSDNYLIGEREGYCYLSYTNFNINRDTLLKENDFIMEIQLFDKDKQLVNCYKVHLSTKSPYTEYGYKDNQVQINNLQIYDGFIMNSGQIIIDKQYENNRLFISCDEELKNDDFAWLDIAVGFPKTTRNHIIYKEKYTHIYIGKSPHYYIHIIDENNQCVKMIEVEKQ